MVRTAATVGPARAHSRRELLAGSTVVLGAAVLGGCGASDNRHRSLLAAERASDAGVLNSLLAVEQKGISAYTAAGPLLNGFAQRAAHRFLAQELEHAGQLRLLVKQAGARAHRPEPYYNLGQPTGAGQVLALLHEVEREQLSAYMWAIPRIARPESRQSLASIMANDAQHVSVLRAAQHGPALADPLLTVDE